MNRFLLMSGLLTLSATALLQGFPLRGQSTHLATVSDGLPSGAIARLGTTLLRHGDGVHFAAYLPGGKELLTASRDGTIRLWELPAGKEIRRFVPKQATSIADQHTSKPASGHSQTAAGKLGPPARPNEPAALSPDGQWVATARNRSIWVWEVATGKLQYEQAVDVEVTDLAFSGDSASLGAIGNDRSVTFLQSRDGKILKRVRNAVAEGKIANDPFSSITVLSTDLKYLAWQQIKPPFQRYIVKVIDLENGKEPFGAEVAAGPVTALAFSTNSRALITSPADGSLHVLDLATRKDLFRGGRVQPAVPAKSVNISPDGKRIGVIRATGAAEVWDMEAKKRLFDFPVALPPELPGFGLVSALLRLRSLDGVVAFAPDGKSAAVVTGETAATRLFDLASGAETPSSENGHHAAVSLAQPSRDGKSLLTFARGEPVAVWEMADIGDEKFSKVRTRIPLVERASRVAVSAEGNHLAAASGSTVVVLDSASGKTLRQFEAKDLGLPSKEIGIAALALSPDGAILATRAVSGPDIRLWDVATGKGLRTLSQATVPGVSSAPPAANKASGVVTLDLIFSPDGRYLAGAGAKWQLCLWAVSTGRIAWEMAFPAGQSVERFAFSPAGYCLATLDGSGAVTLHETATGRIRAQLGETASVDAPARMAVSLGGTSFAMFRAADQTACLAFTPNGRHIAATARSRGIVLWDVLTSQAVGRYDGEQGEITSLAFNPNGRQLVSGGFDTTALVWDVGGLLQKSATALAGKRPDTADGLWEDLAAADAAKAFGAARKLAVSRAEAVAFFRTRIRPAAPGQPGRVGQLVAELAGKDFAVRKRAEAELMALGDQAEPELRKVLEGEPSVDFRQRVERIMEAAAGRNGGGSIRDLRAVELLEMVGGEESFALLETLSRGDAANRITRAAKAALGRRDQEKR